MEISYLVRKPPNFVILLEISCRYNGLEAEQYVAILL